MAMVMTAARNEHENFLRSFTMSKPVHLHDQITARNFNQFKLKAAIVERCVYRPWDGKTDISLPHSPHGNIVYFKWPKANPDKDGSLNPNSSPVARTQVEVTDRNFKAGDWAMKDGQVGQIQKVSVKADLLIVGTTIVALNIPTERLHQIEDFPEGSYIFYNDWVGRVTRSLRMVTVHVGADNEEDPFIGVVDYRDSPDTYNNGFNAQCPVYPQQKLVGPWHALRNATWEWVKNWKPQQIVTEFEGRVAKVEVKSFDVDWRVYVGNPADQPEDDPERKLSHDAFRNVRLLDSPNMDYFRLGSVRFYEAIQEDEFLYYDAWSTQTKCPSASKFPKPDLNNIMGHRVSAQCLQTTTIVEVLWKDGTTGTYNSAELEPYEATDVDFIRGDYVFKPNFEYKYGVVQTAQHKEKTVLVNWFDANHEPIGQEPIQESTADIKICPGYDYSPGNLACSRLEGFKTFWVMECRADGQVTIQSHETGNILTRSPSCLHPLYVDFRHMNPAPAPPSPNIPTKSQTPMEISKKSSKDGPQVPKFVLKSSLPAQHFFRNVPCSYEQKPLLFRTLQKEVIKLKNGLNEGIYVIGYQDRMDLFSVILIGSEGTPFENFIFLFEVFVPGGYPQSPPQMFYRAFAEIGILPNNVNQRFSFQVNKLFGKDWEEMGLAGMFNSMKECIFVKEPYFSRGYVHRAQIKGTSQGNASSRFFNESLITKLVKATENWSNCYDKLTDWHPELIQLSNHYSIRMMMNILDWSKGNASAEFPLKVISPNFAPNMNKWLKPLAAKLRKLSLNSKGVD